MGSVLARMDTFLSFFSFVCVVSIYIEQEKTLGRRAVGASCFMCLRDRELGFTLVIACFHTHKALVLDLVCCLISSLLHCAMAPSPKAALLLFKLTGHLWATRTSNTLLVHLKHICMMALILA